MDTSSALGNVGADKLFARMLLIIWDRALRCAKSLTLCCWNWARQTKFKHIADCVVCFCNPRKVPNDLFLFAQRGLEQKNPWLKLQYSSKQLNQNNLRIRPNLSVTQIQIQFATNCIFSRDWLRFCALACYSSHKQFANSWLLPRIANCNYNCIESRLQFTPFEFIEDSSFLKDIGLLDFQPATY